MKRLSMVVTLLLVSTSSLIHARQVFDRTELIDLGKEISQTIEQAEIKVKPHIQKEKAASAKLRQKLSEMKRAENPQQKALLWSEVEMNCSVMLKETIDALATLDDAVGSLTGSLIKINGALLKGGDRQSALVKKQLEHAQEKMDQLGVLSRQTGQATLRYIADPKIKAQVFKSLNNIKQRTDNSRKMDTRVNSARKVARKRILNALEMQSELQALLKVYKDEALWRSFLSKLQLIGMVMNETERSLHLDDAGDAFVTHVKDLKTNMSAIEEIRYFDEMNNYNVFGDMAETPVSDYDPAYVDEQLLNFSKYGLDGKEGGEIK